ncbi:MAG: hypothetical protein M3680_29515 [Myxococcota bacterium]|nr:hypothetical protein [Myxococcota bacterium]
MVRLVHYLADPIEELLRDYSYAAYNVTKQQLFAMSGGPVVLTLDDGREVCVANSEELVSVVVQPAESYELDDPYWRATIDATDPTCCEPHIAHAVGQTIIAVRVLQIDLAPSDFDYVFETKRGQRIMAPKIIDRPREVAVVLGLEDGTQLVFSHTLLAVPDNFAVSTGPLIADVPLREVLLIDGHHAPRDTADGGANVTHGRRYVGNFVELGYDDDPGAPSLVRDRGKRGPANKAQVVSYLRAGVTIIVSPGRERDLFDPSKSAGGSSIQHDGEYCWPMTLAYYVEAYDVLLPPGFEAHMKRNGWSVPSTTYAPFGRGT